MEINIREWKEEDADDLVKALNNKKVLDNLREGIPFPYTKKDAEEFINAMLNAKKDSQYTWAICLEDKVIGSIGTFRRDNIHRLTAEIGYYIAEPYWGKGIGAKVIEDVCKFIFENTDIVRVFAGVFANNIASCRVLEKAGFAFEGLLRKNAIKNGEIIDIKLYALVKE